MDAVDDGAAMLDNMIDLVARANSPSLEDKNSCSFLPELRSGPSQPVPRPHQADHPPHPPQPQHSLPPKQWIDRHRPLHTFHGHRKSTPSWLSPSASSTKERNFQAERNTPVSKKLPLGRPPSARWPGLPKETVSPEDLIRAWLEHGTDPRGGHFPSILTTPTPPLSVQTKTSILCKMHGQKQQRQCLHSSEKHGSVKHSGI